jgi:hypothetical protein
VDEKAKREVMAIAVKRVAEEDGNAILTGWNGDFRRSERSQG